MKHGNAHWAAKITLYDVGDNIEKRVFPMPMAVSWPALMNRLTAAVREGRRAVGAISEAYMAPKLRKNPRDKPFIW